MSLKYKVIVMMVGVFALSAAVNFAIQRLVILPSFVALEQEEAKTNTERVLQAISRELQMLTLSASDWAYWDDTYRFAQDRNPGYSQSNLITGSLVSLRIHLLNIYDTRGELIAGLSVDLDSGEALQLESLAAPRLPRDHPLLALPRREKGVSSLLSTAHGPMLVAAAPILTGEHRGPAVGTLVMGRLIDEAAVQRIAEQARLQVTSRLADATVPAEDWVRDAHTGLRHTGIELDEQRDLMRTSTILGDLFGRPLLALTVETPRRITARGEDAVRWALTSLAIAGLLVMGLLLWLLHRTVLDPVARLTQHVIQVGEHGDLRHRLALNRNDEVGVLGREFDRMTARLAEARRQLIDRSYSAGIADMARGVLHNIGNAITPLTVRVSNLQEALAQAPLPEMHMAMTELTDATTPPERRMDLVRFAGLAGAELVNIVTDTRTQLLAVARQLSHVQAILADQEHFSKAVRVVEPIGLGALIADAVAMLSPATQAAMVIEIDEGVHMAGDVVTARTALQQVIINLLVNAAESIQRAGIRGGRLRIDAVPEVVKGVLMAHVRFEDNGGGIAPENLKRIFERGFSTKTIASGQGLHWSATTVASLQGKIYAESAGPGHGACLHLLVPCAIATPALAVGE